MKGKLGWAEEGERWGGKKERKREDIGFVSFYKEQEKKLMT